MDDATGGFALYNLEEGTFIRRLETGIVPKNQRPKQVAFGENGQIVVGGSDHGKVYVYEKDTGDCQGALVAYGGDAVHTITVSFLFVLGKNPHAHISKTHTLKDTHTIISASTMLNKPSIITVWINAPQPHENLPNLDDHAKHGSAQAKVQATLGWLVVILLLGGSLWICRQNIGEMVRLYRPMTGNGIHSEIEDVAELRRQINLLARAQAQLVQDNISEDEVVAI